MFSEEDGKKVSGFEHKGERGKSQGNRIINQMFLSRETVSSITHLLQGSVINSVKEMDLKRSGLYLLN